MPFAYYDRLGRRDQAVYRRSDEVAGIRLPDPGALRPAAEAIAAALSRGDRDAAQAAAAGLAAGVARGLGVPVPRVEVLAVRPRYTGGELHGLYTLPERGGARIQVWMRTARHRRPVAFRTFLRTLLHEVCHHLDFTLLGLPKSFHTEGFFQRESSLFHQLLPAARGGEGGGGGAGGGSGQRRSAETGSP